MVVALGVDVHKKSHTIVAADAAGRQLAQLRVQASQEGDQQALRWACTEFAGEELVWGVEDCRSYSMRLERDLLAAGQQVRRVPAKLMAQCRASARSVGKSDPIDALAVARAVLREPGLPTARLDEATRELRLLVDHRDHLVQQRTRWINRLRVQLYQLDPEQEPRTLTSKRAQRRLAEWLTGQPGLAGRVRSSV
jgi:transposase